MKGATVISDPGAADALAEIHRAGEILDETNAMPLARLDEAEERGRQAIRTLHAAGANVSELVVNRTRWLGNLRQFKRNLDMWVALSHLSLFLIALVFLGSALVQQPKVDSWDAGVVLALAAAWPIYCDVERWRYLRRPLHSVFG